MHRVELFSPNFHTYVIACTIAFFALLHFYKRSVERKRSTNRFAYVLFLPLVLYGLYAIAEHVPAPVVEEVVSEGLLSRPYPLSSTSS